jgi:hypothetical protein
VSETLANGVVIDRSRLSHRDSKRAILLQARLKVVSESNDLEALETLLNEADLYIEKVVVQVPNEFYVPDTPEAMKCPAPGWMDYLRQDKYEELSQSMRKDPVGTEGN